MSSLSASSAAASDSGAASPSAQPYVSPAPPRGKERRRQGLPRVRSHALFLDGDDEEASAEGIIVPQQISLEEGSPDLHYDTGSCALQGASSRMEDRVLVVDLSYHPHFAACRRAVLMAVFDGHAGSGAVSYLEANLAQHLLEEVARQLGCPPVLMTPRTPQQGQTRGLGTETGARHAPTSPAFSRAAEGAGGQTLEVNTPTGPGCGTQLRHPTLSPVTEDASPQPLGPPSVVEKQAKEAAVPVAAAAAAEAASKDADYKTEAGNERAMGVKDGMEGGGLFLGVVPESNPGCNDKHSNGPATTGRVFGGAAETQNDSAELPPRALGRGRPIHWPTEAPSSRSKEESIAKAPSMTAPALEAASAGQAATDETELLMAYESPVAPLAEATEATASGAPCPLPPPLPPASASGGGGQSNRPPAPSRLQVEMDCRSPAAGAEGSGPVVQATTGMQSDQRWDPWAAGYDSEEEDNDEGFEDEDEVEDGNGHMPPWAPPLRHSAAAERRRSSRAMYDSGGGCQPPDPPGALRNALLRCERELMEQACESGTTALVALMLGSSLWLANVGDCRAVVCDDGEARQLTNDHKGASIGERDRLLAAKAQLSSDGYLRVTCPDGTCSDLAVSRNIGCAHLKNRATSGRGSSLNLHTRPHSRSSSHSRHHSRSQSRDGRPSTTGSVPSTTFVGAADAVADGLRGSVWDTAGVARSACAAHDARGGGAGMGGADGLRLRHGCSAPCSVSDGMDGLAHGRSHEQHHHHHHHHQHQYQHHHNKQELSQHPLSHSQQQQQQQQRRGELWSPSASGQRSSPHPGGALESQGHPWHDHQQSFHHHHHHHHHHHLPQTAQAHNRGSQFRTTSDPTACAPSSPPHNRKTAHQGHSQHKNNNNNYGHSQRYQDPLEQPSSGSFSPSACLLDAVSPGVQAKSGQFSLCQQQELQKLSFVGRDGSQPELFPTSRLEVRSPPPGLARIATTAITSAAAAASGVGGSCVGMSSHAGLSGGRSPLNTTGLSPRPPRPPSSSSGGGGGHQGSPRPAWGMQPPPQSPCTSAAQATNTAASSYPTESLSGPLGDGRSAAFKPPTMPLTSLSGSGGHGASCSFLKQGPCLGLPPLPPSPPMLAGSRYAATTAARQYSRRSGSGEGSGDRSCSPCSPYSMDGGCMRLSPLVEGGSSVEGATGGALTGGEDLGEAGVSSESSCCGRRSGGGGGGGVEAGADTGAGDATRCPQLVEDADDHKAVLRTPEMQLRAEGATSDAGAGGAGHALAVSGVKVQSTGVAESVAVVASARRPLMAAEPELDFAAELGLRCVSDCAQGASRSVVGVAEASAEADATVSGARELRPCATFSSWTLCSAFVQSITTERAAMQAADVKLTIAAAALAATAAASGDAGRSGVAVGEGIGVRVAGGCLLTGDSIAGEGEGALAAALIPDPDLFHYQISQDSEFLICACDGLWDVMRNGEACRMVRRWLADGRSAASAAEALCQAALKVGSADNISTVVLRFSARPLLTAPSRSMLRRVVSEAVL